MEQPRTEKKNNNYNVKLRKQPSSQQLHYQARVPKANIDGRPDVIKELEKNNTIKKISYEL